MIRTPKRLNCVELNKPPGFPSWNQPISYVELPFQELVRFYHAITESQTSRNNEMSQLGAGAKTGATVATICKNWQTDSSFYGGTTEEARRYIRDGYKTSSIVGEFLPGVLRTRHGEALRGQWLWRDAGDEIDVGLALAGDSEPFRSFENAPTLGGININALMAFNCGTDFNIIAQYGQWLARLLSTCAGAGISPGLHIDHYGRYTTDGTNISLVRIRVKNENDATDWTRYSSLFSPIGYRHLCFAALLRAAAEPTGLPGQIGNDLGQAFGPDKRHQSGWNLNWDPASRTLTTWGPNRPDSFDEAAMTQQLIDSGALTPREVHA